ncbi:hypothetical protein PFISCL1PPCAC_10568 [Pristionchus fissidentatus]|uniref:Uncharacterized protein n=1 Tax=Pristionchus fissidentatus TaxID=1538716 RepID=A0AAV5VIR1_9BILA|nr:hypothetical protein PFISCL1PPCAC_10568 [Pristionchus fissidentatus]
MFSDDDKKKKNGKDVNFDSLEEKMSDKMDKMSIRDKSLNKYGDGASRPTTVEKLRNSFKKGEKKSTHSLNIATTSEKEKMSKRSSSVDKTNDLTMSLFGAASMVCNIVEISKDSTMNGKKGKSLALTGKNDSVGSDNGKPSGPFSSIKEAQQKKKSVDEQ